MCREVLMAEIDSALSAIDDDKAPRIDCFIAYFFTKCWYVLKNDIIVAIEDFFPERLD